MIIFTSRMTIQSPNQQHSGLVL